MPASTRASHISTALAIAAQRPLQRSRLLSVLSRWPASRTVGAAIRESDRNKRIERRMALLQKLGASMRRSSPSQLTLSRSFAADAHGSAKVPMWSAPGSPSTWKEEHFVFVSLAGWGSLIYGGYKFFTSGPKKPSASGPAPCPEGMERVPVKKH